MLLGKHIRTETLFKLGLAAMALRQAARGLDAHLIAGTR